MEFGATVGSPGQTRAFVTETARSWGLGDVGSLAELLVSELVTNAVEHGASGGAVELEALPAGRRVAVTHHAPGRPEGEHPPPQEPPGRRPAVAEQVSRWWGGAATDAGKTAGVGG